MEVYDYCEEFRTKFTIWRSKDIIGGIEWKKKVGGVSYRINRNKDRATRLIWSKQFVVKGTQVKTTYIKLGGFAFELLFGLGVNWS